MQYLYVDESGSMTTEHCDNFPYFIICSVKVKDPDALRKRYKRFVSKNYDRLKILDSERKKRHNDNSAMFNGDTFKELKGSCFDFEMKKKFVNHFCKSDFIEIFYIKIDNSKIDSKLYKNTARAFNYVYKLMLVFFLKRKDLLNDDMIIQFDERNQRTECKASLEDYLNTELYLNNQSGEIKVNYFDSSNNKIIQIADVLSNVYYSYCCRPEKYQELIEIMKNQKCLHKIFTFPPK